MVAKRICFISTPEDIVIYKELLVEFEYHNGFAITQKQKSIKSMHKQINLIDPTLRVLEVSTKSPQPVGVNLSAFNLNFYDEELMKEFPIENVFQSSKVFEHGGPYRDLLYVHPKEAKRDVRLKSSGNLTHFESNVQKWELEPKSMFYDWIYIKSLMRNQLLVDEIIDYNAFTDIEFNQSKSFNCQARSAAIFVSLYKSNNLDNVVNDKNLFVKIYGKPAERFNQITLLDDI
jgi:hypothetical protein